MPGIPRKLLMGGKLKIFSNRVNGFCRGYSGSMRALAAASAGKFRSPRPLAIEVSRNGECAGVREVLPPRPPRARRCYRGTAR
jgi:hypothetical protein